MDPSTLSSRAQDALGIARDELRKRKSTAFEIFYARSESLKIESKQQKIDTLTRSEDVGLSVRTLENGKMGFSFTTSLEPDAIRRTVASAFQVSEVMPEDRLQTLGDFTATGHEYISTIDQEGLAISVDAKAKLALELEARCLSADSRIRGVRSAAYSESQSEYALLSQLDRPLASASARFSLAISAKAESGGDAQMGWDYGVSSRLKNLPRDRVALRAAERATRLLNAGKAKTGKVAAIIENQVVANLIDFLSSSFSGEEIDKGKSTLRGKLGEKIFHEKITLIDDGLLKDGYASRAFDAEGVASQTTSVIERGVFRSPLLDTYYARKMNLSPTGNSSRGIQSPPSLSTTNFYLKPGMTDFEGLLAQMRNGLFITDLLGVHTANSVTGAFSLGASGLLVEDGKLTRPVKGFAVAGNIFELFRHVTEVGADLEFFGDTGAPSLLIPELAVSGE